MQSLVPVLVADGVGGHGYRRERGPANPLIVRRLRSIGMKVFISSVTHLLKEERAALPPFSEVVRL